MFEIILDDWVIQIQPQNNQISQKTCFRNIWQCRFSTCSHSKLVKKVPLFTLHSQEDDTYFTRSTLFEPIRQQRTNEELMLCYQRSSKNELHDKHAVGDATTLTFVVTQRAVSLVWWRANHDLKPKVKDLELEWKDLRLTKQWLNPHLVISAKTFKAETHWCQLLFVFPL